VAQSVQIAPGSGFAKLRNPWGVLGLTLITLGIYYVFWWYFINREMKDVGNANGVDLGQSPGTSVLAVTVGAFVIIPPFVSVWKTGRRMEGTQRTVGVSGGSGPLFFVLHIIPIVGLFAPVYMQMELNKAWRAIEDPGTSQASELAAAPDTDVGQFGVEADQRAAAQTPLSDNSAEGEHPPGPAPAQERQGDEP
jgi:Domain of unknown function (DUF4234)